MRHNSSAYFFKEISTITFPKSISIIDSISVYTLVMFMTTEFFL